MAQINDAYGVGEKMTRNIGSTDRLVRVLLGIGLLLIAFEGPRTAWGYIGIVPLITGLIGWCPLYRLFGRKSLGGPDELTHAG